MELALYMLVCYMKDNSLILDLKIETWSSRGVSLNGIRDCLECAFIQGLPSRKLLLVDMANGKDEVVFPVEIKKVD